MRLQIVLKPTTDLESKSSLLFCCWAHLRNGCGLAWTPIQVVIWTRHRRAEGQGFFRGGQNQFCFGGFTFQSNFWTHFFWSLWSLESSALCWGGLVKLMLIPPHFCRTASAKNLANDDLHFNFSLRLPPYIIQFILQQNAGLAENLISPSNYCSHLTQIRIQGTRVEIRAMNMF